MCLPCPFPSDLEFAKISGLAAGSFTRPLTESTCLPPGGYTQTHSRSKKPPLPRGPVVFRHGLLEMSSLSWVDDDDSFHSSALVPLKRLDVGQT